MARAPFLALLALALPLCTAPASVPRDEYEVEDAGIEGTWRVIFWKQGGVEKSAERELGGVHFRYTRDKEITFIGSKQTTLAECFYKLDPGRRPPVIHYFKSRARGARPFSLAIYRLRGDRLTLCGDNAGKRPTAFTSEPGTSTYLFEMVREK